MKSILSTILLSITLSGCVAVVPFVEPDPQAEGKLECNTCRASLRYREAKVAKREDRYEKLLKQLKSPSDANRAHAAFWLGEMRGNAGRATPLLIASLSDSSNWVRRAAVKALGKIGDDRALPALKSARNDRDKFVAESAKNVLRNFGN